MSCTAAGLATVYVVGFIVFPFLWSAVDGWPFVKPRITADDAFFTFLLATTWPVCTVAWLVAAWWIAASWLGVKVHKAVCRLFGLMEVK